MKAVQLPPIFWDDAQRFMSYVDRSGGPDACWPYTKSLVDGYGSFGLGGRRVKAHRVAWVVWSGQPEPDADLQLDHSCHDPDVCRLGKGCPHRSCCNPSHLRPTTCKQNLDNAYTNGRQLRERTHCKWEHEYTPENTRLTKQGYRTCLECERRRNLARRRPKRPDIETHCPSGHEWTPENTGRCGSGSKACRACGRERARERYRARLEAATREG